MSRVGKKPIKIPEKVSLEIEDQKLKISGPRGELELKIHPAIKVEIKDGKIFVLFQKDRSQEFKKMRALWGLSRTLIYNGIIGVTEGFEKKLEIEGVGYRASIENENLILNVGLSHPIKIKSPEGIKFSVEKNIITVSGIEKEKVGKVAAKIRKVKKTDPYKGKGIKYLGEQIRKKEGKKAAVVKE
jgi:large subunit ribosomal protein L6